MLRVRIDYLIRCWIADADLDISDESQSPRKSVKDGRPLRMAVSNTPSTPGRVASSSRTQPGIRDYKTPQGPRPPEFTSKRYYNAVVTCSEMASLIYVGSYQMPQLWQQLRRVAPTSPMQQVNPFLVCPLGGRLRNIAPRRLQAIETKLSWHHHLEPTRSSNQQIHLP